MLRKSESIQLIPLSLCESELTDIVTAMLFGAEIVKGYQLKDSVRISIADNKWLVESNDFVFCEDIYNRLKSIVKANLANSLEVFRVRCIVQKIVRKEIDNMQRGITHRIAMLKDKASSGWWRMVLPAEVICLDNPNVLIDCTAASVDFNNLLEYDTIFVQRLHRWDDYYIIKRLKEAGKRIVYDIDDDLFNITPDNPAYHSITRDDQVAAMAIMTLVDTVTVTTELIANRIKSIVGVDCVVIPNALDCHDSWNKIENCGSPDGWKRIFWSGGASHAADWEVCFEAISEIMTERKNVRLTIMGFLPPCIDLNRNLPQFSGRIEYQKFSDPETYYQTIHGIRADVGIAPIQETTFNTSKSSIKFLEYSLIGMPTVASNWAPYNNVIIDKENGRLVKGKDEWKKAICFYLDRPMTAKETISKARITCENDFHLPEISKLWTKVLL